MKFTPIELLGILSWEGGTAVTVVALVLRLFAMRYPRLRPFAIKTALIAMLILAFPCLFSTNTAIKMLVHRDYETDVSIGFAAPLYVSAILYFCTSSKSRESAV